jgi:hypothetical protein
MTKNAQNNTPRKNKIHEDALIWLIIEHTGEGLIQGPTN